jgi:hypothetical protein
VRIGQTTICSKRASAQEVSSSLSEKSSEVVMKALGDGGPLGRERPGRLAIAARDHGRRFSDWPTGFATSKLNGFQIESFLICAPSHCPRDLCLLSGMYLDGSP